MWKDVDYVEGVSDSKTKTQLQLDLYGSQHGKTGSSKLLVYIHGGSWVNRDKADYETFAESVTKACDVSVAVVNYRLSGKELFIRHPVHTKDVLDSIHFLVHHKEQFDSCYDENQVYLFGHSAGAFMSLLIVLNDTKQLPQKELSAVLPKIKGVFLCQGLYEMADYYHFLIQIGYPQYAEEFTWVFGEFNTSKWFEISPMALFTTKQQKQEHQKVNVEEDKDTKQDRKVKIVFIHSKEDAYVPGEHAKAMYDVLKNNQQQSRIGYELVWNDQVKGNHFEVITDIENNQLLPLLVEHLK